MVREVARSHQLQEQVEDVREAFAIVERVIEEGQAAGAFRRDLDARLASWVVYGGLEEVLTGWVLGQLPDGEEEVARAERTAIELALRGLAPRLAPWTSSTSTATSGIASRSAPGWRSKDAWVGARIEAELLGGSLYELEPGDRLWPYHTHHANEEWLVVIRGTPTLRTPEGEHELAEGDVVCFRRGKDGPAPGSERHGHADSRVDALDPRRTRHRRIPGLGEARGA